MSEQIGFVGNHYFRDEEGNIIGTFVVFKMGDSWYWQSRPLDQYQPMGPYATAEGAYLGALGE